MHIRHFMNLVESFGKRGVVPGAAPAQSAPTFGKRNAGGSDQLTVALDKIRERYQWQGMGGLAAYTAEIAREHGLSAADIKPHLTADTFRSWDRSGVHR
jgi:hypothetical protein